MDRSVFTPPHSPPSPPFNQSFTPSDKVEPLRDTSLPPKEDLSQLFKSDADALIRGEHKKLEPMAPPKTPEEIEKSRRIFEEYYLEISDLDHHINFKHKLGIIELSSHKKAHLILMDPFKSYAGIENEISFQLRETISSLHLNGRNYSIDFTDILEGSIVIEFHHWTWLRSNREEIKKFFVLFYNKLNDINI